MSGCILRFTKAIKKEVGKNKDCAGIDRIRGELSMQILFTCHVCNKQISERHQRRAIGPRKKSKKELGKTHHQAERQNGTEDLHEVPTAQCPVTSLPRNEEGRGTGPPEKPTRGRVGGGGGGGGGRGGGGCGGGGGGGGGGLGGWGMGGGGGG